jgi:choline dehydrogenase-like flavoprotein
MSNDAISTDVVVVGSGIAGALVATALARRGAKVVMLEAGPRVDRAKALAQQQNALVRDIPEAPYPSVPYAPKPATLDPKNYLVQKGPELFGSTYERLVGGTTWHWLGTSLRLQPHDFRLHDTYGVGVDWPISYKELEPWYGRAENEIGVAGVDSPDLGAPRSTRYPMPPIPQSYLDTQWEQAASKIGLRVVSTPQARNSVTRANRPACCGNNNCIPICPIGAKYDGAVHVAEAEKLGVRLLTSSVVHRVAVTPHKVTVRYLRPDRSEGVVTGKALVLAAHAIETPKLMLMSDGLGNRYGNVGRYLMDHPTQLSWALANKPVYPYRGPLSTSGIEMLRDGAFRKKRGAFRIEIGNDGWSWPEGDQTAQAIAMAKSGKVGAAGLQELGRLFERQVRLASLVEPLPDPANRVTLSTEKDALGLPRPEIHYRTGAYASRGLAQARATHERLFRALGVSQIHHWPGPQGAGHIMGTCRMGTDPKTSVVDTQLRVHGHQNCFVVSSAVYPTVGTANPTLTLAALALRAADTIHRTLA